MAFYGRKKEIDIIKKELERGHSSILLYGRRRFGKTSLLREVLNSIDGGVKLLYTCKPISLFDNAKNFSSLVFSAFSLPFMYIDDFEKIFEFLKTRKERIVIVLDEYQDLKKREDGDAVDSIFRDIIDYLPENISIVLSGSSIRLMSALNDADNPLFERFTKEIHLKEMDYFDSSFFYQNYSVREKIILYSVFGGIPFLNQMLDPRKDIYENIIDLFVEENGNAGNYVKSVIDTEIVSIPDAFTILSAIGNGKKRYSELQSILRDEKSRNQLSRTLDRLVKADLIRKKKPINSDNRNHVFYEICNNALKFYFSYLLNSEDSITVNSRIYFENIIKPSLDTFVSYRFEEISRMYFSLLSQRGEREDILKIGTYWYDDKERKKNGEFDVALKTVNGYEIFECKFLEKKIGPELIKKELDKVKSITSFNINVFGIISSSGFEKKEEGIICISGDDIYNLTD